MPQAAQPIYCTINDAAVPVLCPLARISGHPNATWVVSENHRAAYAAFREPLARS